MSTTTPPANLLHPNVHPEWVPWSNEEKLYIAVAYSNPYRWQSRRRLMNDFRYHLEHTPNVVLYVGELAYGDRPFEVTSPDNPHDVQLRCSSELFHKENILNEVIRHFPHHWKYGGYVDADFSFSRHDWALEAIHKLQHHEWVQLFSTYTCLSAQKYGGNLPDSVSRGFVYTYIKNGYKLPPNDVLDDGGWVGPMPYGSKWTPVGATGGAWCFRRSAFDCVGGLLDQCILGHADWLMTFGLISECAKSWFSEKYNRHYVAMVEEWQRKALQLKRNIGYVDQFAIHHYHGPMKKRGYQTRDSILIRNQFDPIADLRRNYYGIYELTGNKPELRDEIRAYFIERDEDNPNSE